MQNLPGDLVGPLNYTKTKTTKDQSGTQKPATLRLSRSLHTYLWKSSSDTESLKRKKGSLSSVSFTRRSWQKQRAQMAQLQAGRAADCRILNSAFYNSRRLFTAETNANDSLHYWKKRGKTLSSVSKHSEDIFKNSGKHDYGRLRLKAAAEM